MSHESVAADDVEPEDAPVDQLVDTYCRAVMLAAGGVR